MRITRQLWTIFKYLTGALKAGIPSQVYWIINDECNLRCKFCNFWKGIYHKEGKKILNTQEIKNLILQMSNLKVPYLLFTGGEPFLREDMLEILEYAVNWIPHIRVQTNGTLITDSIATKIIKKRLLDEIWLSVDGMEYFHDQLRGVGGVFSKVIDTLDRVTFYKRKYRTLIPYIIVHTVVKESNLGDLSRILSLCNKYRVEEWYLSCVTDISDQRIEATKVALDCPDFYSLQMKTGVDVVTRKNKLPLSLLEQISQARKKGMTIFIDPLLKSGASLRPRRKCIILWASIMISPYGEVLVCPSLDKLIMGDLLKKDLMQVWNNSKFKKIRNLVSSKLLPVCEDCCVQRRTLLAQLKDPANFKRVFVPRKFREIFYKYNLF